MRSNPRQTLNCLWAGPPRTVAEAELRAHDAKVKNYYTSKNRGLGRDRTSDQLVMSQLLYH